MSSIEILRQKVTDAFHQKFDSQPEVYVQAPGRVNIIGEHTDYNDGFVLPCAIDYQTITAAKKRHDRIIRVVAADYANDIDEFSLDEEIQFLPEKCGQTIFVAWLSFYFSEVTSFQAVTLR